MKAELIGAIDIGSNSTRLRISQIERDKQPVVIEDVKYPIGIGAEVFSTGRISKHSVDQLVDIIKAFKRILKEYKVEKYNAITTTALREASNQDYVIDFIFRRTGIKLKVIGSIEEKILTYKAVKSKLKEYEQYKNDGMVYCDLGSGGFEISFYNEGELRFTNYLNLGTNRLRIILGDFERRELDYCRIMEEFVESRIYSIKRNIGHKPVVRMIAIGGQIKEICRILGNKGDKDEVIELDREAFFGLYKELTQDSKELVMDRYRLSVEGYDSLIPSMVVFSRILNWTIAEKLTVPVISLRDGMVRNIEDSMFYRERKENIRSSAINLAKATAIRYGSDIEHVQRVEAYAYKIFDAVKDYAGLKKSQRTLLGMAAILHDVGKFIHIRDNESHAYYIIKATDLVGISYEQKHILSNLVKYHESIHPKGTDKDYRALSYDDRVLVSKLSSILSLATALDITKKGKIKDLEVTLSKGYLKVTVKDGIGTELEEWALSGRMEFFEDVYGLRLDLEVKR